MNIKTLDFLFYFFQGLGFFRIFMKPIGEEPDMKEPLIVRGDHSIRKVCEKIHRDFVKRFQFARIWGLGAKFDGQVVGIGHNLKDKDIVELHLIR